MRVYTVASETAVDWQETARLATEAFAAAVPFDPDRLRWTWERCFAEGAEVVTLRADGAKVGQLAILRHSIIIDGRPEPAGLFVDLFVLKPHRSREAVALLFGEAERRFRALGLRFAVGMPNRRSLPLNVDLFAMETVEVLPLHLGVMFGRPDPAVVTRRVADLGPGELETLLAPHVTPERDLCLPWDAPGLARRLSGPGFDYALHILGDVAAVSSPRSSRGIPHSLICGFFARNPERVASDDLGRLVRAACAEWRRPVFAYCGFDHILPILPGVRMPRPIRPSPLVVQMRDFRSAGPPPRLTRYQMIDSDFA